MFECKNCKGTNIVCNIIEPRVESGNPFYENKDFGVVDMSIQVCWCSDCGEKHSSSIINVSKID